MWRFCLFWYVWFCICIGDGSGYMSTNWGRGNVSAVRMGSSTFLVGTLAGHSYSTAQDISTQCGEV